MNFTYRLLYLLGVKPWEDMVDRPVGRQVERLLDREQPGREPPFGSALDLGCGSGIWTVKLAERGWCVTGVELVPKALGAARRRAQQADADVRLLVGDITRLGSLDLGTGFDLVLDFGAVHGLDAERRSAEGSPRSPTRGRSYSCSPSRPGGVARCRAASAATTSSPRIRTGRSSTICRWR